MSTRKREESNVRKLTKLGNHSIGLTLPIEIIRAFGWKEKQAGYVLAVVGVFSVIVNAILVGKLVKAMGERPAVAQVNADRKTDTQRMMAEAKAKT